MAELKNYVEGQPIEPIGRRVYTTVEEQAELKAYREFGNLSQLRVLCDNYHELLNELRSRPTESEIRAKAISEFAEEAKKQLIDFDTENGFISFGVCLDIISKVAEKLKERE